MIFEITIGSINLVYVLTKTQAPKSYDGFGTIELCDYPAHKERYVLVNKDHFKWQTGRYSSGMHAWEKVEDKKELRKWVEEKLWERIIKV